ncbi:MAG: putative ABC transporter permease [Clostridia bacterium]
MEKDTSLALVPKKKTLSYIQTLLLFFFLYAFIGWLLETAYAFYVYGHFVKRGFLLGPICPIYGCGAVIIIAFLSNYKGHSVKLFFTAAIVFSLFEYIAGFALDALFSARWWDYTSEFMNLNGRISIFFSFVWGIIAILFINHLQPFMNRILEKISNKIPYWIQTTFLQIFTLVLFLDIVCSGIIHLST